MKFQLTPFGKGHEHLATLTLNTLTPMTYILGRNEFAELDKPCDKVQHVSRNHVIINVRIDGVYMHPVARQENLIHYNGKVCEHRGEQLMQPNDYISFLGNINYFNYQLVLMNDAEDEEEDDDEPVSKKPRLQVEEIPSSPSPPVVNATTTFSPLATKLLHQYECSICYEPMACTYTLSPCGDSFCFSCIADWYSKQRQQHHRGHCPCCRSIFSLTAALPNKLVDQCIRRILEEEEATKTEKNNAVQQQQLLKTCWETRVTVGLSKAKAYYHRKNGKVFPALPLPSDNNSSSNTPDDEIFATPADAAAAARRLEELLNNRRAILPTH